VENACGAVRGFDGLGFAEVGKSKCVVGVVHELDALSGGNPLNRQSNET